jgi:hypothetical protein
MATGVEGLRYSRIRVQFFDVDVPVVASGRAVYFPVRQLTEALGMAPQMQIAKLKQDSRFDDALRSLPIPTTRGIHEAVCLNKRHVGMWLSTIDPARCTLKAHEALDRFQAELFAAADRWLFGASAPQPADARGVLSHSERQTVRFACPDCGSAYIITIENGEGSYERE